MAGDQAALHPNHHHMLSCPKFQSFVRIGLAFGKEVARSLCSSVFVLPGAKQVVAIWRQSKEYEMLAMWGVQID